VAGDPPRSVSLTARLGVALALFLLVGGLVVAGAAFSYGHAAAQRAYDRLLTGAASQIAGAVTLRGGAVVVDLPVSAFELLALAPDDRIIYAVFDFEGRLVTGYDIPPPPRADAFYTGAFTGEPARFAAVRRVFAERGFSGPVEVVVGQTTRARDALAAEITRNALIVMGVAGLMMSALAVFSVRSALEPLRRVEAALAARAPRELSPLDLPVPREIGHLVRAMNQFMARTDRQVRATRTLIADASHQIRTPIAALRAQAELAAEETDPARQRAIVARIHDRAVNLGRLTDQMLNRALIIHRADAVPRERLDLRTVAIRAVEESEHDLLASPEDLRLDLPENPVWCDGDALSLVEACKNLIVNAFRYGARPVALSVRPEAEGATIAVQDRGAGIPEADWPRAAERYARQSGVSPTSAGLGLSIVEAVARAHGGALRFGRPRGGGFEAMICLPTTEEAPR
jgi:two-component system sensor histidine kinase TctE